MTDAPIDLAAALRLFDETTAALAARVSRLEELIAAKQAELVEANARLALVMAGVASGVLAVGLDGRVSTANPAARAAIAGLQEGVDWRTLAPDSPVWRVLEGVAGPLRAERHVAGRMLVAQASAIRGADGSLIGAVEVFDDVTELRALAERAERADRLKQLGEMAAGVAHEIRNPLNGIEGFASLLMRDLPEGDKRRRFAELIVAGVRDLNRNVTGLLEFTRPRRLERRAHDPAALAAAVVELAGADAEATATISFNDAWNGRGTVAVDGAQLKQVLINLVRNAVQAAASRVAVTVEAEAGAVRFLVDDDGPGVPEDDRQRIFTPFFTTKEHGTGLGLAVAHTIVSLHGGSLVVEAAPLGGARFVVSIPVV